MWLLHAIENDEVLVDIGYKSEGVIPLSELSIRKAVDPLSVVEIGETLEALVLNKEDDEKAASSSRRSVPNTSGLGARSSTSPTPVSTVTGHGDRSRQGWAHRRHRTTWILAGFARRAAKSPGP